MYPLTTHFNKLRQNTLPPADRLEAAKTVPPLVRKFLELHESFVTVSPQSRLVGSYAQKLCVGDVKDVDLLVFVPGAYEGDEMIEPRTMIADLRRALSGLATHLGYEDDEISIEAARRSVHVHFKNQDFHLDVVPCIAPDGVDEPAYVPCKNLDEWVKTHPVGYIKKLDEINAEHGYNVKRLARTMKHFVHFKMKQKNMRPKSYWLGALLLQVIDEQGFDDTKTQAELFHWLVAAISEKYRVTLDTSTTATPNIKDPILGHNLSWNWGRNAFEMFMARLKEATDWSRAAISSNTSKEDAIALWQKIFGEEFFPSNVEDVATELANSLRPGFACVEPSGIVVTLAAASDAAVAAPMTRFHGGTATRPHNRRPSLSSAIQQTSVKHWFPSFSSNFCRAAVTWKGQLQPRPGSPLYAISIKYRPGRPPLVRVLRPQIRRDAPHLYTDGYLCLYWPKDLSWNSSRLVGETVIPWAAQWLLFYELWLDTGEWLGPESPHRYPGKMNRSE
jgi:hypothetical protein